MKRIIKNSVYLKVMESVAKQTARYGTLEQCKAHLNEILDAGCSMRGDNEFGVRSV